MASDTREPVEHDEIAQNRMSFGQHLEDLRRRMIKSLLGLAIAFAISLYFGGHILGFLASPLLIALRASGLEAQLHIIRVPEQFVTYIKVALFAAIFLSSPWIFYQLWGFVAAGLYPHERRYVNTFMPFSAILFVLGVLFFVVVAAPLSWSFFIRFSTRLEQPEIPDTFISRALEKLQPAETRGHALDPNSDFDAADGGRVRPSGGPLVKPIFTLREYINLVLMLGLAFGLAFQMPLVVLLLGRLSLVSLGTLRAYRKYVFFGIVVAAALLTPPDVFSQIALAVPMYVLYELGIILLRIWPPRSA